MIEEKHSRTCWKKVEKTHVIHLKNFFSIASLKSLIPKDSSLKSQPLTLLQIPFAFILDRWVSQGNSVTKYELQQIITELKIYKRFKHAFEDPHFSSPFIFIMIFTFTFGIGL
jgi:hypothetical protein